MNYAALSYRIDNIIICEYYNMIIIFYNEQLILVLLKEKKNKQYKHKK